MPLIVKQEVHFTATVQVDGPGQDGPVEEFTANFLALTQPEVNGIYVGGDGDAGLLRRVLTGWSEVVDEVGTAVPFSADAVEEIVIDRPWVRVATAKAYVAALHGGRLGN